MVSQVARRAHAVDDVVALAPALDERAEQVGRVLQVDVHRDQDVAPGMVDAGGQGGLLAEVARQVDHPDAGGRARLQSSRAASVSSREPSFTNTISKRRPARSRNGSTDRQEELDRLLFVEHRHDQRQQRIGRPARALRRELALERRRRLGPGRDRDESGTTCSLHYSAQATPSTAPSSSMMPSSTSRSGWRLTTSARNWRSASSVGFSVSKALSVLMRSP